MITMSNYEGPTALHITCSNCCVLKGLQSCKVWSWLSMPGDWPLSTWVDRSVLHWFNGKKSSCSDIRADKGNTNRATVIEGSELLFLSTQILCQLMKAHKDWQCSEVNGCLLFYFSSGTATGLSSRIWATWRRECRNIQCYLTNLTDCAQLDWAPCCTVTGHIQVSSDGWTAAHQGLNLQLVNWSLNRIMWEICVSSHMMVNPWLLQQMMFCLGTQY